MALFSGQKHAKLSPMPTFKLRRKDKRAPTASPLSSPVLSNNRKNKKNGITDNSVLKEALKRITNTSKHLSGLGEKCQSLEDLSDDTPVQIITLSDTVSLVNPVGSKITDADVKYASDWIYESIGYEDDIYDNVTFDEQIYEAVQERDKVLKQLSNGLDPTVSQNDGIYVIMNDPLPKQDSNDTRKVLVPQKAVDSEDDCYGALDDIQTSTVDVNANEEIVVMRNKEVKDKISEETVQLRSKQLVNENKTSPNGNPVPLPRKDRRKQLVTFKQKTDALAALGNLVEKGVDPTERYMLGDQVDSGSSGTVYISRDKQTDEVVAVKIIDIHYQSHLGLIVKELEALRMLKHPCIVNYIGSYLHNDQLWIVMEYLDAGSLTKLCKNMELDECAIATITRDILLGIETLHSHRIIHRDIKSDNILIGTSGRVKLTDFGFCAQLKSEADVRKTQGGTPYWMSPEVIQQANYNEKTDIWSLGILITEMLQGDPPYMKDPPFVAMQKIIKKGRPKLDKNIKVSNDLDRFLDSCFQMRPEKRASASELLKHPFITKNAVESQKLQPLIDELMTIVYQ